MVIDNTYFIDEIFIPHAKPSVTDSVVGVQNSILSFIGTYASECLVKCFGYKMFKEFSEELDSTKENFLKDAADVKWDRLLNGYEYTDAKGELSYWKGIRWKSMLDKPYNKSFLADYVYYYYERSEDDDRAGVGNVKQESKNSTIQPKAPKVIYAWRRFFAAVQGFDAEPVFISNSFGVGVDWLSCSQEKTLYQFIMDMNELDSTNFPYFKPFMFKNKNRYGI